jgi:hypothetical protein
MEIKLITVTVSLKDYIDSGHTLEIGDKLIHDGDEVTFENIMLSDKICLVRGAKKVSYYHGLETDLYLVDIYKLSIITQAVLKQDINFKYIVQSELKF